MKCWSQVYVVIVIIYTCKWNHNNWWGEGDDDNAKRFYERNKRVIFKNCAPFTDCRSKIDNNQIDNAKDLDVAMPMYSLIEYSDNYL